jgi:two-component system LytT family response regulator
MKKVLNILIVDDEPEARDLLRLLLERIPDVRVQGSAESVDQAMDMIGIQMPDLILLDIQMPAKSGFELVYQMHALKLEAGFIFVTAFDDFAIKAIRLSAFDYLLKPVDPVQLESAVRKYQDQMNNRMLSSHIESMVKNLEEDGRIKVNTRTGFIVIDTRRLLYCQAEGNYTRIRLEGNREELVSTNLGTFIDKLKGQPFFRISRSALINLEFLNRVDNRAGTCTLTSDPPVILKVSRSNRAALESLCT